MAMKYLGAYLMAVLGGKEAPDAKDIKTILEAGGISYEDELIDEACKRMEGKQVHELISAGFGKFAACGGGGGGGTAAAAPAASGEATGAVKEEKKKVEEEEEEEEMDFDLFG
ncbi:rpp-2 [Symbiodinium sp. CCMP2456]|nr:rpp-2 [Symbiodinium sp. CCMP2456]